MLEVNGQEVTMETAPKTMRGLLSGFVQSGYSFGFVIASLAYGLALIVFPGQLFTELGWRVMFFTGIIPGLLALFIRLKMDESEIWLKKLKEKKAIPKAPLRKLISDKKTEKSILTCFNNYDRSFVLLLYFYWFYAHIFRKVC